MPHLRTPLNRYSGRQHGPITRLISPNTASGEALKPFVFLDYFDADIAPGFGFGLHPHSGIATLTWQPDTDVQYEDTTGQQGVLRAGGLEWMNAGGGAWHQGHLMGQGRAQGFQLWVAMPPSVENGPSHGQYIPPEAVPCATLTEGVEVRVLLGALQAPGFNLRSPIESHQDMHCFVVSLAAGAQWHYSPPAHHDVAWVFGFDGPSTVQEQALGDTLWALGDAGDVWIQAGDAPARVLIGTAQSHAHPLILGPSSVHTSERALSQGLQRMEAIGQELQRQGRLNKLP